jgi:mannose-1-phosphate guanylyltransferase/mannose-6-phosphate isomerase
VDQQSLFQKTLDRLRGMAEISNPIIVCNQEHRFMVAEQLQELSIDHNAIILEPAGRNTAPAIAAAAFKLGNIDKNRDAVMLVLPADHIIEDETAFHRAITAGLMSANDNLLVTFGITPDRPATGYGYLKASENSMDGNAVPVERFVEKPDQDTAEQYLAAGNYYWNSGMFIFKASVYLQELEKLNPGICKLVEQSVDQAEVDLDFLRVESESYSKCENISVDYAVMERSERVSMVPLDANWNDIGSWGSLWDVGSKDEAGNVTKGDVWLQSVSDSYIHAEHKLVSALGVENLIIVETHDGVMVAAKSHDQEIKQMVNKLRDAGRPETELHRKAFRPWGNYDCLDNGQRFQVKRIMVNSGQCTSMQKHFHRAEHWIVVSGTAEVTCGDSTFILTENESTFIPLGEQHRLRNPGTVPLELIEVQSGTYLGEDDIERIDDEYGRS